MIYGIGMFKPLKIHLLGSIKYKNKKNERSS